MTRPLLPRQLPQDATIDRRLENLERRSQTQASGLDQNRVIVHLPYGFGGDLSLSESWPYPSPYAGSIVAVSAALGTPGTSTTIVQVYIDGVSITSLSLASGVEYAETGTAGLLPIFGFITIAVTQVGAGAKDLGGDLSLAVR